MSPPYSSNNTTTTFVSVHDVAPPVLDKVDEVLTLFDKHHQSFRAELLVIPGLDWTPTQIDRLRRWADAGHSLVGHGWLHTCGPKTTLWHRIHSACLSRDVAEHLSKSTDELTQLVQRCFDWFAKSELPLPVLYVPPAWALGALPREQLAKLPFRFYENLYGYYDSQLQTFRRVPLVGFEADTLFRSAVLRSFNFGNSTWTKWLNRPLRVSIHPHDLSFRLGQKLRTLAAIPSFKTEIATEWLAAN